MHYEVGEASVHSFEGWLTAELGGAADMSRIVPYLERYELKVGEALFKQGEPPDFVELLASGCVAITIEDQQGRPIRLRRMMGYTIVGEMGFYRQVPRTATVIAEEPSCRLPADAGAPSTGCRRRTPPRLRSPSIC